MIKKILISIPLLYFLALFQTSFLFGFPLVIITVVFINIFWSIASPEAAIASALIGGFFLDVFSSGIFGIWVLVMLILSLFIQIILKKYVRTSIFKT